MPAANDNEIFDVREFQRALKLYEKQSSKDFAEVINKAAIDACFKTIRTTPRMQRHLLNKWNPRNKTYQGRVLFALSAKDGWRRGKGIKKEAYRRYAKKRKAGGYLAMMFIEAARDLGAPIRRKVPSASSGAGKTYAEKATEFRLWADLITGFMETGQLDIIEPEYQTALMEAARDMRTYAEGRMAATARKYSSSRGR